MNIFLAMGPGDIVTDHQTLSSGAAKRGETSITFSSQAVRLIRNRGDRALLVSSNPRRDSFNDGQIESRNEPKPLAGRRGILFHLSQALYAMKLAFMAGRFRSDIAIVDSGSCHWFMLSLFSLLRIPVAVNFHNVRWPHGHEPKAGLPRLIRTLDSRFFRHHSVAAMGCSPECMVQVRADGAERLPYFPWTAQYHATGFEPEIAPTNDAFYIVFAGRIERSKGVFDLVEMARVLETAHPRPVRFEICGDGSDLGPLRQAVERANLTQQINVRGRLERQDLLEAYQRSYAIIVPTRGNFCEGMPLVCAEAMLAGRPVITSVLSNALPVIGAAIAEASPESVTSYAATIEKITTEPEYWALLRAGTKGCREQFLDRSQSYAAAMNRLIISLSNSPCEELDYSKLFAGAPTDPV